MKLHFLICIAGFLSITTTSCKKDWLEEKANKNQAIPSQLNDFQALLDATSTMNRYVPALGEIGADGHYVTEAMWPSANNTAKNAYTWTYDFPYVNQESWNFIYRRIFNCNVVLDGLEKNVPSTTSEMEIWKSVKGQALFHRSEAFWHLAQIYGQPYVEASAATDMGIPMRLNSDITESSKRFSVKETYTQILNDVAVSVDFLPSTVLFPSRPGKAAAFALLARTHLLMERYDEALTHATNCLQLSDTLLDYNSISQNATYISPGNMPYSNPEIIFFNRMYVSDVSNFASSNYLIDQSLYDLYHTNDLRKTRFFRVNGNTTINFKGNYNISPSEWFCGIATDEVYLIRAECYARKGNTTNALKDLNDLLRMRWDTAVVFPEVSATTPDEALSKILTERRKELLLRNIRWSDLRRLNKDDRFKITLNRTIGGKQYTLQPGSYKYTFPIPDNIIAISGMPQTPGWN